MLDSNTRGVDSRETGNTQFHRLKFRKEKVLREGVHYKQGNQQDRLFINFAVQKERFSDNFEEFYHYTELKMDDHQGIDQLPRHLPPFLSKDSQIKVHLSGWFFKKG